MLHPALIKGFFLISYKHLIISNLYRYKAAMLCLSYLWLLIVIVKHSLV